MGYIELKWFRNAAFRFLSRWWKVRNFKIKAWKAKLMKSCFSGMKNKPNPRARRAGTWVPRADMSRTENKSSAPGSPRKTPVCILPGRRRTHCWSRRVVRTQHSPSQHSEGRIMAGNAKNRKPGLLILQLDTNKPKKQIKSNYPLKLGLSAVSRTVDLQNATCNNQHIKYPVFVGVRVGEKGWLSISALGSNGLDLVV